MTRIGPIKSARVLTCAVAPLVAALALAGPAAADTGPHATPVAGIPLQKSEDVATNPHALIPDPVLNGSSLGGSVGSAVGSATGTGSAASLLGSAIGALVGHLRPDVIPQVLP